MSERGTPHAESTDPDTSEIGYVKLRCDIMSPPIHGNRGEGNTFAAMAIPSRRPDQIGKSELSIAVKRSYQQGIAWRYPFLFERSLVWPVHRVRRATKITRHKLGSTTLIYADRQ
jgi:hypothetical protein